MHRPYNRRSFIKKAAATGGYVLCGCPREQAWAAPGSGKGALRLAFYTDIHARTEWDTPVAMQQAAQAICESKPDIVLAGGDLITDGFASTAEAIAPRWDAYMAMQQAIGQTVHPALGNHDIVGARPQDGSAPAGDVRASFKEHVGLERTYYSFEAMGYHFIVLDSIHVMEGEQLYEGFIDAEQMAWLRDDLAELDRDRPIILLTHIPLMSTFHSAVIGYQGVMGTQGGPPRSRVVVNAAEVLACFEQRNLILVLQGHLHICEMMRWRGISFITGGAVSAKWWRGNWYGTEEGFGLVELRKNSVSWRYMDYGWDARRP